MTFINGLTNLNPNIFDYFLRLVLRYAIYFGLVCWGISSLFIFEFCLLDEVAFVLFEVIVSLL